MLSVAHDSPSCEMKLNEIQDAIDAEIGEYPEAIRFVVEGRERDAAIWKLFIRLEENSRHGLDESLEGSRAWWPGDPPGTADVLSVIPEDLQLNLRYASKSPPEPGGVIFIYPPQYLHALKARWEESAWAPKAVRWFQSLVESNDFRPDRVVQAADLSLHLRRRQREAFLLPGWKTSYLWGPPGTGKTYTLGMMIAKYLQQFPDHRVLIMSTTNTAVDQALVAVDKALERWAIRNRSAQSLRRKCARVGSHFVVSHYHGREHLLPVKDEHLIRRLTELEAKRPDAEHVSEYAAWKVEVEKSRAAMRAESLQVLQSARLAAMTTTRALFTFDELRQVGSYDLVVFDEASQVPIVAAAILAPMADRVLFAGDPNQLAPIVRSERDDCRRWFGRSMFARRDETPKAVCQLDEQSRMTAEICRIVAGVFYNKSLRVADDCLNDRTWLGDRVVPFIEPVGHARVHVHSIEEIGRWSGAFGGMTRRESANFIANFAEAFAQLQPEEQLLILTPFRAQRSLIRALLKERRLRKVTVSTVHRAQGSERHTVVLDPVHGQSPFLLTDDARRLVNVAISRAQARLLLTLSPTDCTNPTLRQIAELIGFSRNRTSHRAADPAELAIRDPEFPRAFLGKLIRIADTVGRLESATVEELKIVDVDSGLLKTFKLSILRQRPIPIVPAEVEHSPPSGKRKRVLRAPSWAEKQEVRVARTRETPVRSVTDPLVRVNAQLLAAAPLKPRLVRGAASTNRDAKRTPRRPSGPVGTVVTILGGGSHGVLQHSDGRKFAFTYRDLLPELKRVGITEGMKVSFVPGPARNDGSPLRASRVGLASPDGDMRLSDALTYPDTP